MRTVSVFTLGCKVNQYESDALAAKLRQNGYDAFCGLKAADIFIFNTCAVTGEAERKSRQLVARALKLNPAAKIVILGCASQLNSEQFSKLPNVSLVRGNANKFDIKYLDDGMSEQDTVLPSAFENAPYTEPSRIRQIVKIQDGCDRFCSYCIIPYLRGRSRSRNLDDILAEINAVSPHVKEIVLTGIDLSHYGKDTGTSLPELLMSLKHIPLRLRLGSLEAGVISDGLLEALTEMPQFCPHFHLSLQSGSDAVLKKMNRHYTAAEFSQTVARIRGKFPDAGVTTDIIAGFPAETQEQFEETVSFAYEIGFSDIHVFPYSKRSGTVAAKYQEVDAAEKKQRAVRLTEVKEKLRQRFFEKNIGKTVSVLTEETQNGFLTGYTENYIRVYLPPEGLSENVIYTVKLEKTLFDGMTGTVLKGEII